MLNGICIHHDKLIRMKAKHINFAVYLQINAASASVKSTDSFVSHIATVNNIQIRMCDYVSFCGGNSADYNDLHSAAVCQSSFARISTYFA